MHHYIQLGLLLAGVLSIFIGSRLGRGEDEFESGAFIGSGLLIILGIALVAGTICWFLVGGILGF